MTPEELEAERKICKLAQALNKHRGDCPACAYDASLRSPPCGHSACSQFYIDTGERECVCTGGLFIEVHPDDLEPLP